jgi:predicted nucleic acid-binding Zn ribbon protein
VKGRWCCRCLDYRPIEDFRPNPNTSTGLDSWCRSCHITADREWREKNSEYVQEYNERRRREYREQHPRRVRPCAVCGKPMSRAPQALVCGERCRSRRKYEQRKAALEPEFAQVEALKRAGRLRGLARSGGANGLL